MYFKKGDW